MNFEHFLFSELYKPEHIWAAHEKSMWLNPALSLGNSDLSAENWFTQVNRVTQLNKQSPLWKEGIGETNKNLI